MRKEIVTILLLVVATAASGAATATVAGNEPPLVDAGLDQTVALGETVLLDGGGSRDPDGEIASFRWEITSPDGSAAVPDCPTCERTAFVPTRTGVYSVTLTVTDDDSASRTDTLYVTVEGAAGPSVSLDGPRNTDPDTEERYRASVDAGDATLDELVWRVDGTVVERDDLAGRHAEPKLRWTFDDPGQYEVTVTAYDEADRHATVDLPVTVDSDGGSSPAPPSNDTNDPPSVSIIGPDRVDSGDYETFDAVADDPDGVVVTYDWFNAMRTDLMDPTRAGHHFTAAPGDRVVVGVTVTDNRGATATATKTVEINESEEENVPPDVTLDAPDRVEACDDTTVDVTANADDPDGDGIKSYTWSGVDSSNWKWASRTVNADDSREIGFSVEVEDNDGGTTTESTTITLVCQDPGPSLTNLRSSQTIWSWKSLSHETYDPLDNGEQLHLTSSGPASDDTIPFSVDVENPRSDSIYVKFEFGTGETRLKKVRAGESKTVTVDYAYPYPRSSPSTYTVKVSAVIDGEQVSTVSDSITVKGTDGLSKGSMKSEAFTSSVDQTQLTVGEDVTTTVGIDAENVVGLGVKYRVHYGDGAIQTGAPSGNKTTVTFSHAYEGNGEYVMTIEGWNPSEDEWITVREEAIHVDKTYTVYEWDEKETETTSRTKTSWDDPGPEWKYVTVVDSRETFTGRTKTQAEYVSPPSAGSGYRWDQVDSWTEYGITMYKYKKYELEDKVKYRKTTTTTERGAHRQTLYKPRGSEVYGNSLTSSEYQCSNENAPRHDDVCDTNQRRRSNI